MPVIADAGRPPRLLTPVAEEVHTLAEASKQPRSKSDKLIRDEPSFPMDESTELQALVSRATRSNTDREHLLSFRGNMAEAALCTITEVSILSEM